MELVENMGLPPSNELSARRDQKLLTREAQEFLLAHRTALMPSDVDISIEDWFDQCSDFHPEIFQALELIDSGALTVESIFAAARIEARGRAERGELLFHLTFRDNLDGIWEKGLLPGIGQRARMLGETTQAIYAFPSLQDAEEALGSPWVENAFDIDSQLVLLDLDVSGLRSAWSEDVGYEVQVLEPVSQQRIRVVTMDAWEEESLFGLMPRALSDALHQPRLRAVSDPSP